MPQPEDIVIARLRDGETRDRLAAAAQRPEERPDVLHQRARLLHGREVAAPLHARPALHVEDALGPGARRLDDLPREDGAAGWHLDAEAAGRELVGVDRLVIEAARRVRGLGDPVEHDGGEQLVLREAALDLPVAVAPGAALLDDPRGEAGGRGVWSVGRRP